jgi:hypothetical protein
MKSMTKRAIFCDDVDTVLEYLPEKVKSRDKQYYEIKVTKLQHPALEANVHRKCNRKCNDRLREIASGHIHESAK